MVDKDDFAILDARYKRIEECNEDMKNATAERHALELKIEKGLEKMNILIGILAVIAVPIVSLCVKNLFGG